MDELSAADAYDAIGVRYERVFGQIDERDAALAWLRRRLAAGARVLDVGSGTGVPTARVLAEAGLAVTGIDVSPVMIELARSQVPDATFVLADVREFDTPAASWDAICAFFSLLQMTRAEISAALANMAQWLRPGGCLVLATIPSDSDEAHRTFLGQPIVSSSYPVEVYLERIREAGFTVLDHRTSTFTPVDPQVRQETQLFVYAQR